MTAQEARRIIEASIQVTRQQVIIAKRMLAKEEYGERSPYRVIEDVLRSNGWSIPLTIHESSASHERLAQVGESIGWKICLIEALWELVRGNFLIPTSDGLEGSLHDIAWSNDRGSGGLGLDLRLKVYPAHVPARVLKAGSWQGVSHEVFVDADLYMRELGIDDIHDEVKAALGDAVSCFRHELYTPCLAMLTKASEGAWIEMGVSLTRATAGVPNSKAEKLEQELKSPDVSLRKKMLSILVFYERRDLFEQFYKDSGIKSDLLRAAWIWADTVRESRNAVHYGTQAPVHMTYEIVAALLLAGIPQFRLVYSISRAATSFRLACKCDGK